MAIYLTMILLPEVWDRRVDAIMPARRTREAFIRPIAPPRGLLRRLATKFLNPTGERNLPETLGMYRLRTGGSPVVEGGTQAPDLDGRLSWVKFRTSDPGWFQTCPVVPLEFDNGSDTTSPDRRPPRLTDFINDGAPEEFRPRVADKHPAPAPSETQMLRQQPGWASLIKLLDGRPFLWADLLLARELSIVFEPRPVAFAMQQDVRTQFVEQGYWEFRNGQQRYSSWSFLGKAITAYRYELPDAIANDETIADDSLSRDRIMEHATAVAASSAKASGSRPAVSATSTSAGRESEERIEVSYDEWFGKKRPSFARFFHDKGLARFFRGEPFPMSSMPIGQGADLTAEEVPLASER